MEKSVSNQRESSKNPVWGHVINWALMIVMTVIAFIAVGMELLPPPTLIALILFFAVVQVVLQIVFFMHMRDERIWPGLFMFYGIVAGVVFTLGLWWMT